MKQTIFFTLAICLFFSCISKVQPKKIELENADSRTKLAKVNPKFLDTMYSEDPLTGVLTMIIEVRKGLDTIYMEDPRTGDMIKIISDPNEKK